MQNIRVLPGSLFQKLLFFDLENSHILSARQQDVQDPRGSGVLRGPVDVDETQDHLVRREFLTKSVYPREPQIVPQPLLEKIDQVFCGSQLRRSKGLL